MIAIVDYGVGNLFSLMASLRRIGAQSVLTREASVLAEAQRIILPGVGAFGDAADKLREAGLFAPLQELAVSGKPLLGICLGMQLLFDSSCEYGEHAGLGLIPGHIADMRDDIEGLKIPQMGWNALRFRKADDPLLKNCAEGDYVYFVHSFYAKDCEQSIVASVEYGVEVPAVVRCKNVCGTQFHPEKSGDVGLSILRAFAEGV